MLRVRSTVFAASLFALSTSLFASDPPTAVPLLMDDAQMDIIVAAGTVRVHKPGDLVPFIATSDAPQISRTLHDTAGRDENVAGITCSNADTCVNQGFSYYVGQVYTSVEFD
jgi:hypothetical protein